MSQKFIGIDDAAEKLGVSKEHLNALREKGDLRAYRDGASWKFRTEDIEKLEKEGVPPEDDSAGLSDDDVLDIEPLGEGDDAESILLTEGDLDDGPARPPSTIIGKADLDLAGSDLELTGSSPSQGSFADLEELEIDLEAESSRILEPDDAAAAIDAIRAEKEKAEAAEEAPPASSDITLDDDYELDIVGSSGDVAGASESDASKTGELPPVAKDSDSSQIELGVDEQDDVVLGDSSDDMPLATSDSGINLAPSDSGIALDDVPLDLAGSAIGSALDLAALSAVGEQDSPSGDAGASGDDFLLTPVADEESDEDSSQVVALEEIEEEADAGAVTFEEEGSMPSGFSDIGGMSDLGGASDLGAASDLGGMSATGLESGLGVGEEADADAGDDFGMAAAPEPAAATAGVSEFPTMVMVMLICTGLMMTLCAVVTLDLIQSIWAWDQPYALNSSIIDGILGIFGG